MARWSWPGLQFQPSLRELLPMSSRLPGDAAEGRCAPKQTRERWGERGCDKLLFLGCVFLGLMGFAHFYAVFVHIYIYIHACVCVCVVYLSVCVCVLAVILYDVMCFFVICYCA